MQHNEERYLSIIFLEIWAATQVGLHLIYDETSTSALIPSLTRHLILPSV